MLYKCNPEFFPNISFLLKLRDTLPVTISKSNRTFSTMKRLKKIFTKLIRPFTSYYRSLALLSVECTCIEKIEINSDDVISCFAKEK